MAPSSVNLLERIIHDHVDTPNDDIKSTKDEKSPLSLTRSVLLLTEENEVLRRALERTESSRASLAERLQVHIFEQDRIKHSQERRLKRAKQSWLHRIDTLSSEKQKLVIEIEELKHEKNCISQSLREAKTRLSHIEQLFEHKETAHEKIVDHWIKINKGLIRENALLRTQLEDEYMQFPFLSLLPSSQYGSRKIEILEPRTTLTVPSGGETEEVQPNPQSVDCRYFRSRSTSVPGSRGRCRDTIYGDAESNEFGSKQQ